MPAKLRFIYDLGTFPREKIWHRTNVSVGVTCWETDFRENSCFVFMWEIDSTMVGGKAVHSEAKVS